MLIYSYSKPRRTGVLLLEKKVVLKYKKGFWTSFFFVCLFLNTTASCCMFSSEQTVCLTMEMVTVIVLLSKNEPLQELTHEGLQNT